VNQKLVVSAFADDTKAAVAAFGDRRQRRFGEAAPIALDRARLDLEFFGAAQNLFLAELAAIAVHDLLGIGSPAEKPQNEHKTGQTRLCLVGGRDRLD